MLIKHHPNLLN
jgi:hypothetical protein